jgi:predicted DNA-binding protein with PD1-like motif
MHGTLAWKKDSVSVHAHGVVADKTFRAFGGHILEATVGTGSVEIFITVHDKIFERKKDESIGADVLSIDPVN